MARPPSDPLGRQGEEAAARFLKKAGVRLIERNFRCDRGEIDLIGLDRGAIVFFEVKTRRDGDAADPESNVGPRKQQRLMSAARYWLAVRGHPAAAYRFDAVSIIWPVRGAPRIERIVDAFRPRC